MKNMRPALIALTAALTLGITACGGSDGSDGSDSASSSASGKSGGSGSGKDGAGKDGAGKDGSGKDGDGAGKGSGAAGLSGAAGKQFTAVSAAIAAAEKKTGGTVYEVDAEDDGGWDADIAKGSKTIDATVTKDGKATIEDEEDDRDDAGDRAVLKKAKITVGDALEAALKETDGTLEGAELEEENGKAFWEVTVGEREVAIDASNGKVLTDVGGDTDDDADDTDDNDDD